MITREEGQLSVLQSKNTIASLMVVSKSSLRTTERPYRLDLVGARRIANSRDLTTQFWSFDRCVKPMYASLGEWKIHSNVTG